MDRAPLPVTLGELLEKARRMKREKVCQADILDWIYEVCEHYGIRMRNDEHSTVTLPGEEALEEPAPAPAEASSAPLSPAVASSAARGAAAAPGVTVAAGGRLSATVTSYRGESRLVIGPVDAPLRAPVEPPPDKRYRYLAEDRVFVGRVILSCDRRNVSAHAPICMECNGVVIDALSWEILALPPRAFNPRAPARIVDGHLKRGLYQIIKVLDGTVVTIYPWVHPKRGKVWCLASGNGYDVSPLRWMGGKAYAEVLYDLLKADEERVAALGLRLLRGKLGEGDVRLAFDGLSPDLCYTIGFRHENFHPLAQDPPGLWNIQVTRRETGEVVYGAGHGLPHVSPQLVYRASDLFRSGAPTLAGLRGLCADSLEEAKKAVAHNCVGSDRFNYGYILRSQAPAETREHSDILVESKLIQVVRRLVYQKAPRADRDNLDHTTRLEFNVLRAYLTLTVREDLTSLFSAFRGRYAAYDQLLNNLVDQVIKMQRQASMAPNTRNPQEAPAPTALSAIAQRISRHMNTPQGERFDTFRQDARAIVMAYVARPEYAYLYMMVLRRE